MNTQIAEKLKETKLDFSSYGRLPIRDDVYLFVPLDKEQAEKKMLLKQWEKLLYLRNHLSTIDQYIRKSKGETVNEWIKTNKNGLSANVLQKIGAHNNDTGGISAYFFNLQNYYDEQEALYDTMESQATVPEDVRVATHDMRRLREEKRKNRRAQRKILMKDMRANGKGYLEVVLDEEPEKKINADAGEETTPDEKNTPEMTPEQKLKKASNVGIWVAGVTITVAVVFTAVAVFSKEG